MSLHIICGACGKAIAHGEFCEACREKEMNAKFKTIKSLLDSGAISIPEKLSIDDFNSLHQPKKLSATEFKPLGLTSNVRLNIEVFDRAIRDGLKLNLVTGKYSTP